MQIQRTASNIFDTIIDRAAHIGAFLCCFIILLVTGAVISRYVFHLSQAWVIELTEYCLFYITFLSTAWLLKKEGHVKMDVLVAQMAPRPRAIIGIITSIMCAIVTGVLVWYTIDTIGTTIEKGYVLGHSLRPPMAVLMWVLPFGFLTLFVQFLRGTYGFVKLFRAGSSDVPEKTGGKDS